MAPSPPQQNPTGSDWITRIQGGDSDAFEQLYRLHADGLIAFVARYVGDWEEANELVHDLFLRIWMNRSAWRVQTTIQAYLYGAARNASLNAIERQRVRERNAEQIRAKLEDAPEHNAGTPSPGDDPRVHLRDVVMALPERQRTAIALRYESGLTYAEIGEAFGISHVAARKLVLKSEERIRKVLG